MEKQNKFFNFDSPLVNRDLKAINNFANWLYEKYEIDLTDYIEWYEDEMKENC